MSDNPIKKRLLLNAILLIAIGGLGLAVWLSPEKDPHNKLVELDKQGIAHIRVERRDREIVVLEKQNDFWMMLEPFPAFGNPYQVKNMMGVLNIRSDKVYPIDGLDPAEFGLSPPIVSVAFGNAQYHFGEKAPIEDQEQRYVLFDNKLHVVEDNYVPILNADLDAFIDHNPLPEYAAVTRYQLPNFTISKTDTGGWQIEPEDPKLDADTLQKWVNRWKYASATDVQRKTDFDSKGTAAIIATLEDGKSIQLDIVYSADWQGLYRADMQLAYTFPEGELEFIQKKPEPPRQIGAQPE